MMVLAEIKTRLTDEINRTDLATNYEYCGGLSAALDIVNEAWKQWDEFQAVTGGDQLSFSDWLDLPIEDAEGYNRKNLQRRDL